MQYHWIVKYDQQTHKFEIDWDSTQIILNEDMGVVFDPETMEWTPIVHDDDFQYQIYYGYSDLLAENLDKIDPM